MRPLWFLSQLKGFLCSLFSRCWMLHIHIHAAFFEFIEHLAKPLFFRLLSFGSVYPTDIVVLLIGRALIKGVHQASLLQGISNEIRHRVPRPLQVRIVSTHNLFHWANA